MSTVDAEILSTGAGDLRPVERKAGRRVSRYGGRWVPYVFLLPYLEQLKFHIVGYAATTDFDM